MPSHTPRFTIAFNKIGTKPPQSQMKFTGKYKEALEKVSVMLEAFFEGLREDDFEIYSIIPGNQHIRLKIRHSEANSEMQVKCVFWYHHDDEKYGKLNIDLATSGFSRKGKVKFVGTFDIQDHAKIQALVEKELRICVKSL